MSTILRIEHPVLDYDMWKNLFDIKGPNFRARFEARRYQVLRPVDDPRFVMIDVDFDSRKGAEGLLGALRELWGQPGHNVDSDQQARIVEAVESVGY
jgi:hypothetical protein